MHRYRSLHKYTHIQTNLCTNIHTYRQTHIQPYIHTDTCAYIHIYIHRHTYRHTYKQTYIHIIICTYIHTYIQLQPNIKLFYAISQCLYLLHNASTTNIHDKYSVYAYTSGEYSNTLSMYSRYTLYRCIL